MDRPPLARHAFAAALSVPLASDWRVKVTFRAWGHCSGQCLL